MERQSEKLPTYGNRILRSVIIPLGLLAAFVASCLGAISYMSCTADEDLHLVRGIMLLKTGDYRLNRHHPPLANVSNAIPLLFMHDLRLPSTQSEEWKLAEKGRLSRMVAAANGGNRAFVKRILNPARLVTVAFMAVTAFILFMAVKKEWGIVAALAFLLLYILGPNIIAHSSLVTTDAWLVPLVFGATFALYRYTKTHRRIYLCIFAILAFLSLVTKYSAVPVAALWLVLLFLYQLKNAPTDYPFMKKICRAMLVPVTAALVWAFLLTAAYGFRFKTLAETTNNDRERIRIHLNIINDVAGGRPILAGALQDGYQHLPLPFPEYVIGFLGNVVVHDLYGHEAFLFGRYSKTGWWYYFPLAMLLKVPIPFLAGIAWLFLHAACRMLVRVFGQIKDRGRLLFSFDFRAEHVLITVPIFFFALAMASNVNIGLRHILPVFPFLALAIGIMISKYWSRYGLIRVSAFILAVWFLASSFRIFPHYLEYFNELIGGPSNGFKYLLDSNLDWGQDRFLVQDYVELLPRGTVVYVNPLHEVKRGLVIMNVDLLMGRFEKERPKTAWLRDKVLSGKIKPIDRIAYTHMVFEF
jgi:hypothetical protein